MDKMSGMRRHLPSTQALACFEAAARHESYTRAAQELALTQSAVSRQIIALEEFVGVVRRYGASRDVQEMIDAANQPAEVAHLDIARACGTCMLRLA